MHEQEHNSQSAQKDMDFTPGENKQVVKVRTKAMQMMPAWDELISRHPRL
jgi:hypothetical protein